MVFLTFLLGSPESSGQRLYPRLKDYIVSAEKEFEKIPGERQEILKNLGEYIVDTESKYNETQLLFVCHENARRSQFAQIWAQTAAHYYRLKNIKTYSGGIHETAINYRILESLKRAGFNVTAGEAYSENPVYLVSPGRRYDDMFIFSKRFDYWNNPNDRYATILCSRDLAGKDFDFPGTEKVLSLHYENIDIFDNSPGGGLKNDEICRTFAREMLYLMDHVKKLRKQKRKRK
jgi:arsenate reductase